MFSLECPHRELIAINCANEATCSFNDFPVACLRVHTKSRHAIKRRYVVTHKSRANLVQITCYHVVTECKNELGAFPRLLKTEADKRLLKPLIDVYLQVCFLLKTPNGNKEYAVKLEEVSGSTNIQDGYEFGVPNVTVRI